MAERASRLAKRCHLVKQHLVCDCPIARHARLPSSEQPLSHASTQQSHRVALRSDTPAAINRPSSHLRRSITPPWQEGRPRHFASRRLACSRPRRRYSKVHGVSPRAPERRLTAGARGSASNWNLQLTPTGRSQGNNLSKRAACASAAQVRLGAARSLCRSSNAASWQLQVVEAACVPTSDYHHIEDHILFHSANI